MIKITAANRRALCILLHNDGIGYSSMFTEGYGKYKRSAIHGLERSEFITPYSRAQLPLKFVDHPLVVLTRGCKYYVASDKLMRMTEEDINKLKTCEKA